jgi:hypothetical protein
MRCLIKVAPALLASMLMPSPAGAGSEDAGNRCPAGSAGRDFDGLLLCVPADNERYSVLPDGVDWMAWLGDNPIPRPRKDTPVSGDPLQMTLARAWIGAAVVGTSDSASGQNGFDHFMSLIAASIQRSSEQSGSDGTFAADVPVDESGALQRFQFSPLEDDLLLGKRTDETTTGPEAILFRPSSGLEHPHVMLCGSGGDGQNPTHVCMSMRDMAGHRLGIMVTGTDLRRSFRIAEQVGADLESFVVTKAP